MNNLPPILTPLISDQFEVVNSLLSMAALFAVIFGLLRDRIRRREDKQVAAKDRLTDNAHHAEQIEILKTQLQKSDDHNAAQVDKLSALVDANREQLKITNDFMKLLATKFKDDTERDKAEKAVEKEQRLLDARPNFRYNMGGTGPRGIECNLKNIGGPAYEPQVEVVFGNVEMYIVHTDSTNALQLAGEVTGVAYGTREQGETPFELRLTYSDKYNNRYEQQITYLSGAYRSPIVGNPKLIREADEQVRD